MALSLGAFFACSLFVSSSYILRTPELRPSVCSSVAVTHRHSRPPAVSPRVGGASVVVVRRRFPNLVLRHVRVPNVRERVRHLP